jgi:hypothetical protein
MLKGRCGRVTDIEARLTKRTLVVIHLVPRENICHSKWKGKSFVAAIQL